MDETKIGQGVPAEEPAQPAPEQAASAQALNDAAAALEQAAAASGEEGADPEQTAAALAQAAEALKQAAAEQENGPRNAKERLYDKVNIPIWLLDVIIWGCVAGIVLCIIFGRS